LPLSQSVKENIEIEISGSEISKFQSKMDISEVESETSSFENITEIILAVITAILWIILVIYIIAAFFKRIRRDEIEFKRAIGIGIVAAVAMFAGLAIEVWPSWEGALLGGGFSGLFVGIGIVAVYAVTESVARDIWPSKIKLADLMFLGRFDFKELGESILYSFFITGLSLVLFGMAIWLVGKFDLGVINTETDQLLIYSDRLKLIGAVVRNIVAVLFMVLIIG
jgi:hypothetical protein